MTLIQEDRDKFAGLLFDLTPRMSIPWLAIGIAAVFWLLVTAVVLGIFQMTS